MVNGDVGRGWGKGCGKALVPQSAPLISAPTLSLKNPVEKKEPHSGVLAGFLGSGGGKSGSSIQLDLKGLTSHKVRCKSAVFWQTERLLGVFSTGTEKGGFTGFSGIDKFIQKRKGA
jgi:hypothetical protein